MSAKTALQYSRSRSDFELELFYHQCARATDQRHQLLVRIKPLDHFSGQIAVLDLPDINAVPDDEVSLDREH